MKTNKHNMKNGFDYMFTSDLKCSEKQIKTVLMETSLKTNLTLFLNKNI